VALKSCGVTIKDLDGVSHSVEVTAAILYEAVAQGLAANRGDEWVAGIPQGINVVKVSVASVRVEHEVRLQDFTKWLEKPGGLPGEVRIKHSVKHSRGTILPPAKTFATVPAAMGAADWLDLAFLKFISQHTSAVMGVLLSVVIISRSVEWAIGAGVLKIVMEYSERTILVMIFLYFPVRVFLDLVQELRARGRKD
jgi:hypothetical protein